MGLLSKLGLRLPSLKAKARIWRLTVRTEGNDPHRFVCAEVRGLDNPVILHNSKQFVMPEEPAFEETELAGTKFRGTTVPVHCGHAVFDEEDADLEIPEYFHGETIPVIDRDDGEIEALFKGDTVDSPPG